MIRTLSGCLATWGLCLKVLLDRYGDFAATLVCNCPYHYQVVRCAPHEASMRHVVSLGK